MSAIAKGVAAAPSRVAAVTGIAQDNIIFAGLLLAFIIWITTKGELPTYLSFFKPGASQGPAATNVVASSTTGAASPAATAAGTITSGLGQGAGVVSGILSGNVGATAQAVGGAIYNGIVQQPLNIVKSVGKSIGIPGF